MVVVGTGESNHRRAAAHTLLAPNMCNYSISSNTAFCYFVILAISIPYREVKGVGEGG